MRVPFVIYADFETFCQTFDTCSPDPETSFTENQLKYETCGYGYQVVSLDAKYTKTPKIYRGQNVSKHFLESMIAERDEIENILKAVQPYKCLILRSYPLYQVPNAIFVMIRFQ